MDRFSVSPFLPRGENPPLMSFRVPLRKWAKIGDRNSNDFWIANGRPASGRCCPNLPRFNHLHRIKEKTGESSSELANDHRYLTRFFVLITVVIVLYLVSIHFPNPYRSENPDLLYWGALFQMFVSSLYPAADIGYLILVIVCIWFTGRYRWLTAGLIVPVCLLGLAKYHPDIIHGTKASLLNASLACFTAFVTIPIARRISTKPITISNLSILDLFVLVTLVATTTAYLIQSLTTHLEFEWWPYTKLTLLEHSIQALLNVSVALVTAFFCLRPRTVWAFLALVFFSLMRWCHAFIIYQEDDGITTDFFETFDLELVSIWWMPITVEILFLTLCLIQMWRYTATSRSPIAPNGD